MPAPDANRLPTPSAVLSLGQLLGLSDDPRPASSPLHDKPYLVFEAHCGPALSAAQKTRLKHWLGEQAVPVIALGHAQEPLAAAADVVLPSWEAAAPLLTRIARTPHAASILVQLLRLTSKLPLADALVAESLAYATLQAGPEFAAWRAGYTPPNAPEPDEGPAVLIEPFANVLNLRLNRPNHRNAMTVEMRDALIEALELALADPQIHEVRMRGEGRCFSTGGDLREFGTAPNPAAAHAVRSIALPGRLLARLAERASVLVHGACVGSGIEFPAFASHLIAREDAWFQLPELQFGLIPGAGGCVSIPRRIGRQRTAWWVLSGARINAQTALDWGLVDGLS